MRRRLLLITKDPEFDERGEVVLGQCEPFTSGWRLILVHPDRTQEDLIAGTYSDLRKIQENCGSIEKAEDVRKRVHEMRALINSSVTETVAVDFGDEDDGPAATKLLDPTRTDIMPPVKDDIQETSGDGFFEMQKLEGVVIALLADPDRASDVVQLGRNLGRLLEGKPKAIVLDLGRIQNLASRAIHELVRFRDQCEEDQVGFGLCNLRKSVLKLFENLETPNPPAVYESSEAALAMLVESE